MKRFAAVLFSFLLLLSFSACGLPFIGNRGDDAAAPTPKPLDLSGEWTQSNSYSDGNYQAIYISDDYIQVFWILGSSNGAALFWAGTFDPPENLVETDSYEWESEADTSRTTMSLLTDKGKSLKFQYENGKIKYDVDYEDVTMTVTAEKKNWGYSRLEYWGTTDLFDVINGVYQGFVADGQIPVTESVEEEAPEIPSSGN